GEREAQRRRYSEPGGDRHLLPRHAVGDQCAGQRAERGAEQKGGQHKVRRLDRDRERCHRRGGQEVLESDLRGRKQREIGEAEEDRRRDEKAAGTGRDGGTGLTVSRRDCVARNSANTPPAAPSSISAARQPKAWVSPSTATGAATQPKLPARVCAPKARPRRWGRTRAVMIA